MLDCHVRLGGLYMCIVHSTSIKCGIGNYLSKKKKKKKVALVISWSIATLQQVVLDFCVYGFWSSGNAQEMKWHLQLLCYWGNWHPGTKIAIAPEICSCIWYPNYSFAVSWPPPPISVLSCSSLFSAYLYFCSADMSKIFNVV